MTRNLRSNTRQTDLDLEQDGLAITGSSSDNTSVGTLKAFIDKHNLTVVDDLRAIGHIMDEIANGNCGYDAFIIACWYAGFFQPLIHPDRESWSSEDRALDLATRRSDVNAI